ncbi:hypothetical protein SAMN04883147_101317 [Streptomyces sp. DpondAA-F4]|nr:hypothetical protein SAMN04883147_101317 [Streptomyces sp. DpondAA-F4]
MAQSAPSSSNTRPPERPDSAWAAGGTMFAGVLLLVDGILDIFKGIAGIASDDVYERITDYTFKFDVTAWGWIHLILGVVLFFVGLGILRGAGMGPGAWVWGWRRSTSSPTSSGFPTSRCGRSSPSRSTRS